MAGANLTRIEADSRSKILTVDSYEVSLDLTTGEKTFEQETVVKFKCSEPGAKTFIDAVVDTIHSVTLNGKDVDTSGYDGQSIFLSDLAAENTLVVRAATKYVNTGEGLHRFVDPADGEVYLYTQFEPNDAHRVYASFDQPDLKATFTFTITAPAHWEVISNSPVVSRDEVASGHRWSFGTTPRISTYITALVAGPYHHVHDVHKGTEKEIPLGIYCRKSLAPYLDAEDIFLVTKQGFTFFEKEFGLAYPFEKYDQIACPEYNFGAMENSGCVTWAEDLLVFRSKVTDRAYLVRAMVTLHEMAHMWFGDLVTMKWWNDLWLNESFAEWAAYTALGRATRFDNAWVLFNAEDKNWAYRQDQLSSTHPIVGEVPDLMAARTNLDGITYAKGASSLQVLSNYCGEENFLAGLRKYFAKHAWSNATLNDLLVELAASSGRNLDNWSRTWLQTAGVNTLRPDVSVKDGSYDSVKILQAPPTVPAGSTEIRPHSVGVGLYDLRNGSFVRRHYEIVDVHTASTDAPSLKGQAVADLLLLNDGDTTYAKVRFDENSLKSLAANVNALADPLMRALCLNTAWDMTRDAELDASTFVPLLLDAIATEQDVSVLASMLLQLETAVELFASAKNRDRLRTLASSRLNELASNSVAGSDHQLAFTRAFANFANSDAELAYIQAIFDGSKVPAGLVVDQELRWHLLLALVTSGKAGASEIDAEAAKDQTSLGQRSSATCRAAIPTLNAKKDAYALIMNGEVPNAIQRAACTGFRRAAHRDLLANFIDPYFNEIVDRWNAVSFEIATQMLNGLFPSYNVSADVLNKVEGWLKANQSAPSALLRYMSEQRDGLERAVKAQQRDA